MSQARAIINERAATHGDYKDTARIAQAVKDALRSGPSWPKLSDRQRESLELIATKTARIVSGDHSCADHWRDGAGYFELGID